MPDEKQAMVEYHGYHPYGRFTKEDAVFCPITKTYCIDLVTPVSPRKDGIMPMPKQCPYFRVQRAVKKNPETGAVEPEISANGNQIINCTCIEIAAKEQLARLGEYIADANNMLTQIAAGAIGIASMVEASLPEDTVAKLEAKQQEYLNSIETPVKE